MAAPRDFELPFPSTGPGIQPWMWDSRPAGWAGTDSTPRSISSVPSHATRQGPEGLQGRNVNAMQELEASRKGCPLPLSPQPPHLAHTTRLEDTNPTVATSSFLDNTCRCRMHPECTTQGSCLLLMGCEHPAPQYVYLHSLDFLAGEDACSR